MGNNWPFGDDADRNDPLTELRIAVTGSHSQWCYLVAFDRESALRPTDREALMLASYLEQYKTHWYGPDDGYGYRRKLAQRDLDVDGGANGVTFHKWGPDDWGYRRRTWTIGPLYVPMGPGLREHYPEGKPRGPMTLEQVMDYAHTIVDDVNKDWIQWKADHPEMFGTG